MRYSHTGHSSQYDTTARALCMLEKQGYRHNQNVLQTLVNKRNGMMMPKKKII
jgi:hypothetical protein